MALNLWKTEGNGLDYSPLSTSFLASNRISALPIGDYIVSFNAYSPTNKSVRVKLDSVSNNNIYVQQLTATRTRYTTTFNNPAVQTCYIMGNSSVDNDIVIDSINFVRKPLPALTINGVDGFLSGKWSFHANVTVLDNESISFVGTGSAVSFANSDFINVASGQDVVLSIGISNVVYAYLKGFDSGGTQIFVSSAVNSISATGDDGRKYLKITIPSNVVKIKFQIEANATSNTVITSRPTVNLGSSPAPYEAKKGDRMVMPISSGKNLSYLKDIKANVVTTTILGNQVQSILLSSIKVKPNTTYTLSLNKDPVYKTIKVVTQYDNINTSQMGHNSLYSATAGANKGRELDVANEVFTFTTTANENFASITTGNATTGFGSTLTYSNIQLEEGSVATAFTPYAVQGNEKPMKYVPKKNLIQSDVNLWEQGSGGIVSDTNATRIRVKNIVAIKPNTSYSITTHPDYETYFFTFDRVGTYITPIKDWGSTTFNSDSNTYFVRVIVRRKTQTAIFPSDISNVQLQLEEGSTATSYEPYTPVVPKSQTGLSFNGVSDYIRGALSNATQYIVSADVRLRPSSSHNGLLGLTGSGNKVSFTCVRANTGKVGYWDGLNGWKESTKTLNYNEWYKVEWRLYSDRIEFYTNGIFDSSSPITSALPIIDTMYIGSTAFGTSEMFCGDVKNIRVNDIYFDFTAPNNIVGSTVLNQSDYVSKNLLKGTSSSDITYPSGVGTTTANSEYAVTVTSTNWNSGFTVKAYMEVGKTYTLSGIGSSIGLDIYNPDGVTFLLYNTSFINGMTITPTYTGIHLIRFKNNVTNSDLYTI
jgi:hypothetical protein